MLKEGPRPDVAPQSQREQVLGFVRRRKTFTVAEVCKALNMSAGTVGSLIATLQYQEYVTQVRKVSQPTGSFHIIYRAVKTDAQDVINRAFKPRSTNS